MSDSSISQQSGAQKRPSIIDPFIYLVVKGVKEVYVYGEGKAFYQLCENISIYGIAVNRRDSLCEIPKTSL